MKRFLGVIAFSAVCLTSAAYADEACEKYCDDTYGKACDKHCKDDQNDSAECHDGCATEFNKCHDGCRAKG